MSELVEAVAEGAEELAAAQRRLRELVATAVREGGVPVAEVARAARVTRATIYNWLEEAPAPIFVDVRGALNEALQLLQGLTGHPQIPGGITADSPLAKARRVQIAMKALPAASVWQKQLDRDEVAALKLGSLITARLLEMPSQQAEEITTLRMS